MPGYPPERADRRFEPETLIGREREFSVLYDAWLEARRKSPRIVVVTSDPGVGKTTLVNAFASSCQMDGAVVARAQAYDAERELPFAVLGELVKQLATQRAIGGADPEALSELTRISSEILKAFPGVPKPVEWSPELMPLRIADAFLKTVTAAAADSPVMLVVDDIHAADNASTAILHSVARKLSDTRVLLILTSRTSELRLSDAPWDFISDVSIARMRSLDLEVLPTEAAEQLVHRLITSATKGDPPVDRILRASGGNPLAIELLTREWLEHGAGSLLRDLESLDTQPVPTIGIPRAIGVVFERQTRRLEPAIRATLDLAAVLGRRLTEVALYAAIELSPGQAAEALSRLHDEGYLREVRGDLEFRNELIRAQAYYAVAGATRQHLHRRLASLLAQNHSQDDRAVGLEIAWHHLRSGDVESALPFAIEGAEAVLAVGAPQSAEEILRTILDLGKPLVDSKRPRLLLAKALVDQSKVDRTLQIVDELSNEPGLSPQEQAEVALLRAAAEYLVNKDRGSKYCDVAKLALQAAKNVGDPHLIAQALFECARAGTEEGISDLVRAAEAGIQEMESNFDLTKTPLMIVTRGFCRFFLGDPVGALAYFEHYLNCTAHRPNAAQLGFTYSGIGISNYFLGRFDRGLSAYLKALDLARKVGDDARISIIAGNLCTMLMHRGEYDESIRYGRISIRFGEASSSSTLLLSYVNLVDPYLLTGQQEKALECIEKARQWLGPEGRWKLRCTFLVESASFALIQRNLSLAMDLIDQLETIARGREDALPMPGPYWKLVAFRRAHLGRSDEAYNLVRSLADQWKATYVIHYLDMLATMAWLEHREKGQITKETAVELGVFDVIGSRGKRALLTLQGFLPNSVGTCRARGSETSGGLLKTRSAL